MYRKNKGLTSLTRKDYNVINEMENIYNKIAKIRE